MASQTHHDRALERYIRDIGRYPLLSREAERKLAEAYVATGAEGARERLVTANLRFVVKTAHSYRGYGLRLLDLIQEGNMGLIVAVRKFDPNKGFRLISYAVWWIRAFIQSYIMRAWSLVKVGTTQAQRRLFFRLRAERERADRALGGARATAAALAATLKVSVTDIEDMEQRLGDRDFSLDSYVVEGGRQTHVDLLRSEAESQESQVAAAEMVCRLRTAMAAALDTLSAKERYIALNRVMRDEPPTLQQIGEHLAISRERVRQIEGNIVRKLRQMVDAPTAPVAA